MHFVGNSRFLCGRCKSELNVNVITKRKSAKVKQRRERRPVDWENKNHRSKQNNWKKCIVTATATTAKTDVTIGWAFCLFSSKAANNKWFINFVKDLFKQIVCAFHFHDWVFFCYLFVSIKGNFFLHHFQRNPESMKDSNTKSSQQQQHSK